MTEQQDKVMLQSADELKKKVKPRNTKKGRVLLFSLVAMVLLAALVIGVTQLAQKVTRYVEANTDHTIHLTDETVDRVRKIEIKGKTAVTITCRGGIYSVRELSETVTSQSACASAFANAATLLAESVAAENVVDFSDFGLDEPISVVKITYADRELTLEIGDMAPASQHYYVRINGEDTVYLMRQMIVRMFSDGISAYRDLSNFAVSVEDLSGFKVESRDAVLELQHFDKIEGSVFSLWQMIQPAKNNTDGAKTEALVASAANIALESFVKTAREGEFAEYGLEHPWRTLTLTYRDGATFEMALGDTNSLGHYYANFDGTDDIYIVDKESVSFLDQAAMQTLVSEFANIIAINGVDALDVILDGRSMHFAVDRSGEEDVVTLDGAVIDAERYKRAFQATNVVPINGIVSWEDAADAPAVLTLIYTFGNGEEAYVVEYLDSSINNYVLRKNGSVSVSVSKEAMQEALELWRAFP